MAQLMGKIDASQAKIGVGQAKLKANGVKQDKMATELANTRAVQWQLVASQARLVGNVGGRREEQGMRVE